MKYLLRFLFAIWHVLWIFIKIPVLLLILLIVVLWDGHIEEEVLDELKHRNLLAYELGDEYDRFRGYGKYYKNPYRTLINRPTYLLYGDNRKFL